MRILVTNDDGIDSVGLHVLAAELCGLGEIVVAAPNREFSGAAASIGSLFDIKPTAERLDPSSIDSGIEGRGSLADCGVTETWAVDGPPALIVMLARLGAFGDPFDLVVSGINPGCNVGAAVYHSGTIGAALTARNGGVSGIAISQDTSSYSVAGQGRAEDDGDDDAQLWQTAAIVATAAAKALIDSPPAEAVALNLNVGNIEVADIKGWRRPPLERSVLISSTSASLISIEDSPGHFAIGFDWGQRPGPAAGSDRHAVHEGYVSVTWLNHFSDDASITHEPTEAAIEGLLGAD